MILDLPGTIARVQSAPTPTVAFRRGEAIELCRLAQRPEAPFSVKDMRWMQRKAIASSGSTLSIAADDLLVLVEFALGCAGE